MIKDICRHNSSERVGAGQGTTIANNAWGINSDAALIFRIVINMA